MQNMIDFLFSLVNKLCNEKKKSEDWWRIEIAISQWGLKSIYIYLDCIQKVKMITSLLTSRRIVLKTFVNKETNWIEYNF